MASISVRLRLSVRLVWEPIRLGLGSPKTMTPFHLLQLLVLTTSLPELLDCREYKKRENDHLGSRLAGHQGSKLDSNGGRHHAQYQLVSYQHKPEKSAPRSDFCRDGNDGPWSSFTIQIGTPPQAVRVFPSTSGSSVWAVVPQGCTAADPSDCPDLRGSLFDPTMSSTWVEKSIYNLPLTTEEVWGFSGNGQFGLDNVVLSYSGGQGPVLNNTMLAGIATKDFLIGTLGLTPWGVNFTNFNQPAPSVLTSLKNAGKINSNSWGYTAGAYYTPKQTYGSLTFGGYDGSRFVPNNLSITRGLDISRDLLVGVQSITSSTNNLLPHGIIALIDSTVPQIWLPLEACQRFEEVFGLEWDEDLKLYLVNDTLHEQLVKHNPTVTFTIASTTTSSDIINIDMPYGSFDLTATWPLTANGTSRYFPLRRADNASQYVLGRTFLQQA